MNVTVAPASQYSNDIKERKRAALIQAPNPYNVRPERFKAYTTSRAVTVLLTIFIISHHMGQVGRIVLPLGVFCVCNRVANDIFEEDLEDTTGFLIDEAGDTFDTTTSGESTNSL